MNPLLIVQPLPIAAIAASRGDSPENLASRDPKETWADSVSGSPATLTVDLGQPRVIDTVFLGYVLPPAADATWSLAAGIESPTTLIQGSAPLRVPDVVGDTPELSHALWTGSPIAARYLAITIVQPAGAAALTAGIIVVGKAFIAELGPEWGSGRQTIDTGTATSLPSGGFSVVEGARKRLFKWSFGDLSAEEADRLELIAVALGTTVPGLVIENAGRTPGLRSRIRYGLFKAWQAFERRNHRQTRWEISIEDWV